MTALDTSERAARLRLRVPGWPRSLLPGLAVGLVVPIALAVGWEAAVAVGLAEGRLMPPPSRIAETLAEL